MNNDKAEVGEGISAEQDIKELTELHEQSKHGWYEDIEKLRSTCQVLSAEVARLANVAGELREERDALMAAYCKAEAECSLAQNNLARAESALAEARNKALDEAAGLFKPQTAFNITWRDEDAYHAVLALKSKP